MNKFLIFFLLLSTPLLAEKDKAGLLIQTVNQAKIRPSYPFPDFLSTGPYLWYSDADNKPIKGHTYRIATFSTEYNHRIYIEKVEFGDNRCCLEIVEYRQLIINEIILKKHFPANRGIHGFKLLRWVKPEIFEFEAYGGKYRVSNVGSAQPLLEELKPTSTGAK